MRTVSRNLLSLLLLTVLLAGGVGTGTAFAADSAAPILAPSGTSTSGPVAQPAQSADRQLRVGDGLVFDEFLRGAGYDEATLSSLKDRQRAVAIRAAYAAGDADAIADIEASLPAAMIKTALAAPSEPKLSAKNQTPSYVFYSCGAGAGVTASFRVFGSWWAFFQTTSGSRTSSQTGYCSDWWNGCLITDSIGGNPSITWRFHEMNATQYGYHGGSCN